MLGTIVQIKPCLDLSSGEVWRLEDSGHGKALQWLRRAFRAGEVESVSIIHGSTYLKSSVVPYQTYPN